MMFYRKTLPFLFAIFIISVLIRIPNLNRPLSKHHEFCTSIALRVINIWTDEGISNYGFTPVMTYGGKPNAHINNQSSEIVDANGNYYYLSHPPLAYLMPFILFKLIHIDPSNLALQLFNIFFHFITGIFIYLLICLLSKIDPRERISIPALIGFAVYLFTPGTLWFHSNVYMSDTFVQVFWVAGVFVVLKMIYEGRITSAKWLTVFGMVNFLMLYTTWLGALFSLSVIVYSLVKVRSDSKYIILFFTTLISSMAALFVIGLQYSMIDGIGSFIGVLLERYSLRSGYNFPLQDLAQKVVWFWAIIIRNYITSYLPVILAMMWIGIFYKSHMSFSSNEKLFFFFSLFPVILMHLVLTNYSGHEFTTLPCGLFISVFTGLLIDKSAVNSKFRQSYLYKAVIPAMILFSIAQYYFINLPGGKSWKGDTYSVQEQVGKEIMKQAKDNEVVFLKGIIIDPQIIYYAERNIKRFDNLVNAKLFLQSVSQVDGILIEVQEDEVVKISRFSTDDLN